ncbi:sensor histidine kinase [Corynebacterium uterequi]|uniref:histidine kinase n=1 Tax=Corynebacterium uterequi TaxID=1072256 RepID=A0A0G3HEQ1_9CORY|nr:HAMP domain-containing sensor histidine kinase [Corynebacterium uterequi]AKK11831.1 signal transduction histidine kinase [Corynebacterium uterequi]
MGGPTKRRPVVRRVLNLHTTLLVAIILLAGLGFLLSSAAVTTVMRGIIISRVDSDLSASLEGWTQDPDISRQQATKGPPSEFSVLIVDRHNWATWVNAGETRPDLSTVRIDGSPTTVGSLPGSAREVHWRAMGTASDGGITVVAKSLEGEQLMISGLIAVQVAISLLTLVMMGFAASWVVRKAIRPMEDVQLTASAIADGNFSRRVPSWPKNTEIGQLAAALNKMLERLQEEINKSQAKESQMRRFIGDASHELRTPLTSVRGYTELYRSGATDDIDKVLSKIDEESARMQLLVEDLLALTRAEGQRLDVRPVDLLEVTLSARSTAQAAFAGREVSVVNTTEDMPVVNGDPDRLHQVLLNLISNALRHAGEAAKVTLRLRQEGRDLYVDVIDDGVGMPREVADHIFERFYRADTSRSRSKSSRGGSGLGLAITRALVEQHGGDITVTSVEGEGSTFTVRLPRLLNPQNASR